MARSPKHPRGTRGPQLPCWTMQVRALLLPPKCGCQGSFSTSGCPPPPFQNPFPGLLAFITDPGSSHNPATPPRLGPSLQRRRRGPRGTRSPNLPSGPARVPHPQPAPHTHSAFVRFLPRVPPHVHHQHVLGFEGLLLS